MREITETYKVYEFQELEPEVQANVIAGIQEVHGQWWFDDKGECVLDEWREKLEALGYEGADIRFSGFWSQGDGASFTATIDLEKWLKAHKLGNKYRRLLKANEEVDAEVYRTSHYYSHQYTVGVHIVPNWAGNDALDEEAQTVAKLIEEEVRELSSQIYHELEADYDEYTSEEHATEYLQENGGEYTEDGKEF